MKKQGCLAPAKRLRNKNEAEFATAYGSFLRMLNFSPISLEIKPCFDLILFQIGLSFLDEKSNKYKY